MAKFSIILTSSGIQYSLSFVDKEYNIYNPELVRNESHGVQLNQDSFSVGLKRDFPEYVYIKAATGEKVFDLADELMFEHTEEHIYETINELDLLESLIYQN